MAYNESDHPRDTTGRFANKTTASKPGTLPVDPLDCDRPADLTLSYDEDRVVNQKLNGKSIAAPGLTTPLFQNCKLEGTYFRGNYSDGTFDQCSMDNAVFEPDSIVMDTSFSACDMRGVDFNGANLCGAEFENCDLKRCKGLLNTPDADSGELNECDLQDTSITANDLYKHNWQVTNVWLGSTRGYAARYTSNSFRGEGERSATLQSPTGDEMRVRGTRDADRAAGTKQSLRKLWMGDWCSLTTRIKLLPHKN